MIHYPEKVQKRRLWPFLFLIFILFSLVNSAALAQPKAILLDLKGAIGPATSDYVHRGFVKANEVNAKMVILRLDTPGGLDKAMRDINQEILASSVPVVGFVAPSGARAASAGTFILYACHIAAMSPGTNLGAASPVSIGMPGMGEPQDENQNKKKEPSTMEHKAMEDAAAYIRSLAQLRGRNVEWAESAVFQAKSLTADEALKQNVINFIAKDIPDLLHQINGKTVDVRGLPVMLQTENMEVEVMEPGWRSEFLSIITDPSVAYLLLIIGIYGLFFEFAHPGMILPGVVGAICLLVSLYAFQMLPINYVGLGLMLLGIAFMVAEAFFPSFGALGIGGIIAFAIGSVMLLDTGVPGFDIALPLILVVSLVTAVFFLAVIQLALRSRYRPIVSGREELIGSVAQVQITEEGLTRVRIHGELWQVKSDQPLTHGQTVKVIGMEGLILIVVGADPRVRPQDPQQRRSQS